MTKSIIDQSFARSAMMTSNAGSPSLGDADLVVAFTVHQIERRLHKRTKPDNACD